MSEIEITTTPSVPDAAKDFSPVKVAYDASVRFGSSLDLDRVSREIAQFAAETLGIPAMVLRMDSESERLVAAAASPDVPELSRVRVPLTDIPFLAELNEVTPRKIAQADYAPETTLGTVIAKLNVTAVVLLPIVVKESRTLVGVIVFATDSTATAERFSSALTSASIALRNALTHNRIVDQLAAKTHELALSRRVDRELNDTMKQRHVFEITLDWAMRVALAQAASLAVYDQSTDELRYAMDIGYERQADDIALLRKTVGGGIAYRVARSGHTEIVPDVSVDSDYLELSNTIKSHISVPVMREDRVIAVISVESRKLNAFNDDHVDFIEKLATRAGVAIDNARLYADAVREREKYSLILGTTSDVVLAIGKDDRIIQINPAALAALRLYADQDYVGRAMGNVLSDTPLHETFKRVKPLEQPTIEELTLADGHIYHTSFTPHAQIGWIIVMHDITDFKRTDQLKSELVATVSHDLRQPLMVMNGYVDLMLLHKTLDERGERYVKMLVRSIQNMRRLIEDLLDLAKIESGMQLQIEPINIHTVIEECVENARPVAESKSMTVTSEIADGLPAIAGDSRRLVQIFSNLINNAIKYTPPEGSVKVWAEQRDETLRVGVQDNGVGISPQDQARIFDRFFRVRNAENESIEGTGLGLAIVKRLIDGHKGQIGLESRLGQGSTFFVTLPLYKE